MPRCKLDDLYSALANQIGGLPFVIVTPGGPTDGGNFGPNTPGTVTGGLDEACKSLSSGGFVFVAAASYSYTGAVTHINANTVIFFADGVSISTSAASIFNPGSSVTNIQFIGNGCALSGFTAEAFNIFNCQQVVIDSFNITGSSSPGTNNNIGIWLLHGSTGRISNCLLTQCGNSAHQTGALQIVSNTAGTPSHDVDIRNVTLVSGAALTVGCNIGSPTSADQQYNITISDCKSESSTADGFDILIAKNVAIVNCIAVGATSNGFCLGNATSGGICQGVSLIGCQSYKSGGAGIVLGQNGGTNQNLMAVGCVSADSNQTSNAAAKDKSGFAIYYGSDCVIEGCVAYDDQGTPTQAYGITEAGTVSNNLIVGNNLKGNGTSASGGVGTTSTWANNKGYNPLGYLSSQPSVATGPTTNTYAVEVDVYVYVGSTATTVTKNSTSLGSYTSQVVLVRLGPGETITLSQTTSVTWQWFGE